MKRLVFVFLAIMIPIALICNGGSKGGALSEAFAAESETGGALGVDQLMKNVHDYPGSIIVEGVVSAVSPKAHLLSLIDTQEYKECAVVTCATLTLPVRWAGAMPSIQENVRVEGQVKENKGKLFFEAKSLQRAVSQSGGSQ